MKIYSLSLALQLLLSHLRWQSSSKPYQPHSLTSTTEKIVFQNSGILLLSYCYFIFHTSSPLAETISQCGPQTLIVRKLLAAAHLTNFSMHFNQIFFV